MRGFRGRERHVSEARPNYFPLPDSRFSHEYRELKCTLKKIKHRGTRQACRTLPDLTTHLLFFFKNENRIKPGMC